MRIVYDRTFYRQLRKLNIRIIKSLKARILIFSKNPSDPILNNHPLEKKYIGHKSINITADWRAIYYEEISDNVEIIVHFVSIGTHKQLYTKKQTA